jgi:hypothetical protein
MSSADRFYRKINGVLVELSAEEYAAHMAAKRHRRGLGDLVAAVATPIASALKLPCIDPATKQLRPESGCGKRKAALNRLTS